jgi:hypothetical protein
MLHQGWDNDSPVKDRAHNHSLGGAALGLCGLRNEAAVGVEHRGPGLAVWGREGEEMGGAVDGPEGRRGALLD